MRFAALALGFAGLALTAATDWDAAGKAWWKNVEFLASDDLQGRNVGSPGYEKAAQYVATQFERAGLKAAGTSGYFQPVSFTETALDASKTSLALVRNKQVQPIAIPADAQLGYSADSASSLEAPVVFAGYGLIIPDAHHNDLTGLSVKGAIVAFLTGGPQKISGNLRSHYSSAEERWKAFQAAGAIGFIGIPDPKSMEIPWPRQSLAWGKPRMRLADPSLGGTRGLQFSAAWNPDKTDLLFRDSGHTFAEILDAAHRQQPLPHFAMRCSVRANVVTSNRPVQSQNIVGVLPGSDPALKEQYVVISAHLDHVGTGTPINGDGIYNGAMDDASGIASVIEIAKAMRASGTKTKRSLMFLAVTGEEKGELGSIAYAGHPTVQGRLVADLNMDMFLPLFPLKWLEVQGLNESTLGDDIRAVASAAGVKVQADKEPDRNRFIRSDQYSFIKKGVPALAFKFGYIPGEPEEKIFKDWYTNRYHGVGDDLSQPVDLAAAAHFNDILRRLAIRVADSAQPPHWLNDSFFRRFATTD